MKKGISFLMPFLAFLLCLLNTSKAWAITYDCAIQSFNVVQENDITKNLFTITISQKGKSHSSPYSWYNTTATLVLESNDRTLEGTYSSTNADGNNKINTTSSYVMYGTTKRILQSTASTFRIDKVSDGNYRVRTGYGIHTQNEKASGTKQDYLYCYASADPSAADPYANSVASVESEYNFTFTPKYATAPTGVTASAIAGTTATISWTSSESAWQYVCLPSSTSLTEARWTSNKVSTNSKSVNLTGLTPATAYTFYVISDRGASGTSAIASTEFTTDCAPISTIPWNEGFESATSGQTPTCWKQLLLSTGGWFRAISGSSYRHTGSKAARIYGGSSNSGVIAVFPECEDDINDLAVSFYYKATVDYIIPGEWESYYGKPQFGYVTVPDDPSTFKAVGDPLAQSATYILAENLTVSGAPSGSRFAIRYSGGTEIEYMYIDDITITEKPACNKPTGVAVTADSETAEGATITWNANGSSAWEVQVSEGDAASWGELINVTSTSKTFTGLKANTLYYVHVRGNCGAGNKSEWSDAVSFTTLCGTVSVSAASAWNNDFQGLGDHVIPECWDNSASTTTSSWGTGYIWGTYSRFSNTMLAMDNSVCNGGTALINTPSISIPDDGRDYELTFDYANMAIAGNNLIVKISANGGAFADKGTYYPSGNVSSYPGAFSNAVISLADYSGQTIKIQFFANPTSGTSSDGGAMFIDNVSIHKVATCFPPTALAAGNLTANNARITWTAGGSETAWRLQYRADGGDWSAEQAISTNARHDLTGLSANTDYFVRVKAYCDAEDQSAWSEVLSFTPLCAAASMPFEENFSSASELPSCWNTTSASDTYRWAAHENSGAYDVQLRTGLSGEATLRMPAISLSEAAILRFEWKNANGAQVNLYISFDGGTTKTLIPNDLSGVHASWTTKVFDLSAYTGETALIYFVANFTTVNQYAYLDDVEVLACPCEMILNISATPVTGGATISWNGNVKKIRYKKGSDAWSYVTIASANYAGPHTLTGLTPATSYQFCLLPACSAEEEGNWTSPVFFTSKATESIPYYNDFEGETAGEVPFNWSRVSSTEYPQVSYDSYAYHESFGEKGNSIKFFGVNDQIIVLPEFDTDLDELYISLHYRNRDCTMQVGYVADDGVTFTALETLPTQSGYGEFPYEVVLKGISSAAANLAIKYSNAGASAQAWVDNVRVDIATCAQPTSVAVNSITANSAHISWAVSNLGTETRYQYICRLYDDADPNWASATLLGENVREVNLSGLTANRDYEFYLRSYCSVSDQSTPVRVEFKTLMKDEFFADVASATNNESRLAAIEGQTVNVIIERPLLRNGDYCTLCLPFNLSAAQIADSECPLHGFVIKEFEHSEDKTDEVDLYLRQVTSIEAGKPYFVRYAGAPTDERLTPLRFNAVKIILSTPIVIENEDAAQPQGVFNPYALIGGDNTTFFLSSNNTLYYASANGTMNGFRAYVHIDPSSPLGMAIRRGAPMRIHEGAQTPTAIDNVQRDNVQGTKILRDGKLYLMYEGKMYDVQGRVVK